MNINVGIGTGDTMQQMAVLKEIAQAQALVAQSPYAPILLDAEKIRNVQARIVELAGFKNADEFWGTAKDEQGNLKPMPQSGPPLPLLIKQEELKADALKFKAQTAIEDRRSQTEAQFKAQLEQIKSDAKQVETQLQLELQAANDARDSDRETLRASYEAQLEEARLALERYQTDADNSTRVDVALINADSKAESAQMNAMARQQQGPMYE